MQKKPLTLGGIPVLDTSNVPSRLAILLWGEPGCGKTTYAATAPGKKLWLNLDPEGKNSIMHRSDVIVAELEGLSLRDLFNKMQGDNPLGLDEFLAENEDVETVVLDSATALSFRALQKAVAEGIGSSKGFVPSMEAPGISAYGARLNIVSVCLTGLLKVTARYGVHCIITTHEDDPKLDKNGEVLYYSMVLGGKIVSGMTWRLSEIWHMSYVNHVRRLSVWPFAKRKPLKSRMFRQHKDSRSIILPYDADLPDEGQAWTIADIWERWKKGGSNKLDLPLYERAVRKLKSTKEEDEDGS